MTAPSSAAAWHQFRMDGHGYVIGRNGERVRVGSRDCAKLDAEGAF